MLMIFATTVPGVDYPTCSSCMIMRISLHCVLTIFSPCLCFRYPSQHVHCSEQSLAGPGQSAGDKNSDSQGQEQEPDSKQHEVCFSLAPLHV